MDITNTISKEKLLREIGMRLKQVRKTFNLNQADMALKSGFRRTTYVNNERRRTFPGALAFSRWAESLGISLDWLICNRGSMVYTAKEEPRQEDVLSTPEAPGIQKVPKKKEEIKISDDIRELLEDIDRLPLLRFEVLAFHQRFKLKNRELFEPAIKITDEEKENK